MSRRTESVSNGNTVHGAFILPFYSPTMQWPSIPTLESPKLPDFSGSTQYSPLPVVNDRCALRRALLLVHISSQLHPALSSKNPLLTYVEADNIPQDDVVDHLRSLPLLGLSTLHPSLSIICFFQDVVFIQFLLHDGQPDAHKCSLYAIWIDF